MSPSLLPEELISAVKYSLCKEEGATKSDFKVLGSRMLSDIIYLPCWIPKFSTAAMVTVAGKSLRSETLLTLPFMITIHKTIILDY